MKKFTFAFKRKPKPRKNLKLFEPQFKADEFNFDVDIKDKVNLSPPIKPIKITNNIIPQPVKKIEVIEKKSEAVDWTDFLNQKSTVESDATRNLKQALQSNALSFTYITLFLQDNQDQLMHFSTTELLDIYSFYKKSKSLKLQEYHIFLKEFCWKGDVKGSLMVYADIKKSGIDPDHFVYTCLYYLYRNEPKQLNLLHSFQMKHWRKLNQQKLDSTKPDTVVSNKSICSLLNGLLRRNKPENIDNIYSNYVETGIHFSTDTNLAFLEGFKNQKDKVMIEKIHFQFTKQSKVLEMKTFEGLMAAHYEIGNNRAVTRLYDDYQQIYQPRLIAVKYYVKACTELELFHFVTTVSNKLLQERRLLDFDTYVALLESFEASGNANLLTKWIKVVKEHLGSDNPISSNILRHLISAVSKIGTLEQGQDLFKEYLSHHEKYSVEINKVNDVNLSPKEMAEMFDSDNQDVLKKFKLWHSPTPARRVLSHMAYLYGKSHDSNLIKSFFTDHVLLSSSLHLHWSRFIKSNHAKLDDLLAKAQDKLDNGGDKSIKETISWVNKRKKRGLVLNTGVEGPFKYVYDGLIHGYKSKETDSVLGLDNLLHELEEYEKATVASLPIKSKFVTLKEI
ncbi:hypothetical protein HK103_001957 [Boothiomyces macroporosus]|uniref:Uncharacterized protein n=1 Tax=Boothiomyces macroporosus TaxID=261099 RepID=A0AAD5ULM4_9FUNG|nr:hypothetical protein HK103_001957 [Boothiomyces macroporosus]